MSDGASGMDPKFWLMALNIAAFVVTWIIQWNTQRDSVRARDLERVQAALSDSRTEMAELKARVDAMPTAALVHELSATLRGVQQALGGLGQRVDGMQRSVERVNDFLLNNRG